MGLDPVSIGIGVASGVVGNIVTDIIKLYAPHLDHTLVGRGLKTIGLSELTREDHLREVLKESLTLYFKTYPTYDISSVADFFNDPVTEQLIANFIFDHRPIDQHALAEALARHLRGDPAIWMYMQQHGAAPEHIIPNFLSCYRQILNEHTDVEERAILLTVYDATDIMVSEFRASEARKNAVFKEELRRLIEALQQGSGNMPLVSGQIIEKYRIQKYLTTGTFGALYLAEQQDSAMPVVLKIINVPSGLRLHYDVFSLGSRLLTLKHPSLLPTLDAALDGLVPYIVTAHADGGSLRERIRNYAPSAFPLAEALTILTQVGRALEYLHQQGIIHRGIQPASILFDSNGNALLAGLDLALLTDATTHRIQLNYTGSVDYAAPEQAMGTFSEKSDQYALGYIGYELCTGHRPFREHPSSPISQCPIKPPLAPHLLNHTIPVQVGRAILKTLSVNPSQRYNNLSDFVAALALDHP